MNDNIISVGLAYPLLSLDVERLRSCLNDLVKVPPEIVLLQPGELLPAHCQVYFAEDGVPDGLGEHPNLKWIQACSAGADAFQKLPNVRNGKVAPTTASGIHSIHIAEFVLASMINLSRNMDALWSLTKSRTWPSDSYQLAGPSLRGATVAILGYGSIGREVGRLASAFGMKIVAITTRSETPPPDTGYHISPGIGDPDGLLPCAWYSSKDLPMAVRDADFLVITCPLTERTEGIVDKSVFESMKSGAALINVGRGRIVDFDDFTHCAGRRKACRRGPRRSCDGTSSTGRSHV